MLNLYGYQEVITSVYKFSHAENVGQVTNLETLKGQYARFLSVHSSFPVNQSTDPFIHSETVESILASAYNGKADIDDMDQYKIVGESYADSDRERRIERLGSALTRTLALDEQLDAIFRLVVHSIFVKRTNEVTGDGSRAIRAYGGSSSNAIGTIWISTGQTVTDLDLAELFIHELTHHLLFIDEYSHHHFNYDLIAEPSNFALSAIRGTMRPLDKVVHSIVVSAELLAARKAYLHRIAEDQTVHPADQQLHTDLLSSIASIWRLTNLSDLLTPRAVDLVARAESSLQSIDLAKVAEA
ncbi:aKG-HExxH-type peptide beta-hydroxylase [Nocardia fusca]|uniref:aKG-HExxH-type peptide beta-hydroxylase n=1 Tax=Nocardia fusca TaxID=941183 RepID=UPI0037B4664E